MTHQKINWGIIGLGHIAEKFATDLLLVENAVLKGVASRNIKKAEEFATKYNSKKYYGSYEELAKDADIDIVYIATPHVFHYENTMLCLENNKAVLCEKPFGINKHEVKTMIDLAKSKKLFIMEAMWTRFIPAFNQIYDFIKDGKIGPILSIEADFGFQANNSPGGRLFNRNLGGGSLLDIGIYPVYLAILLLGIPEEMEAKAKIINGIDASCDIKFTYSNSAKAYLSSTFIENTRNEAIITGEKGKIIIHKHFHHPTLFTFEGNNGEIQNYKTNYDGNGYVHEIRNVNQDLLLGAQENQLASTEISLKLIETLNRIREIIGIVYPNDEKFTFNSKK